MKDFKFQNGDELKDKITGFRGVVISRGDYLTGCNRYALKPQKLMKDKKIQDAEWFDEDQLILIKKKKIDLSERPNTGGPVGEDVNPLRGK
jgi:hypothetical protein